MNKKNILKKTAAFVLGLALTASAAGCSFVLTDNQKDMAQTVAKVDITKNMSKEEAESISGILQEIPSEISKRDLIATFLNYGYSQVQTYGYAEVFKSILNSLVQREIMVQYTVVHYFKEGLTESEAYKNAALAALDKKIAETENAEVKKNLQDEKALLEKHPEVLTLEYFLTENGTNMEDYNYTVYSLRKSFNDSIDSLEAEYIKAEEEEHDHAASQTLPTGVDTQKEKYYPTDDNGNLDYNVYTGRNLIGDCHNYEAPEGSSSSSRRKAYNDFLSNLQSYNLLQSKGGEVEDTKEATLLDYYYVELSSSLGQALINKYFEELEDSVLAKLNGTYAENEYEKLIAQQELDYAKDSSAFATKIDSESATSITLYGRDNFGFVYNILLPYSAEQNEVYSNAESSGLTQNELYNVRKAILKDVKGKDQRAGWINEHEDENYATYDETAQKWNFFTDIISGKSEYEELEHYLGVVPFNGTATLKDEKYEYTYNQVSVDDVVNQFEDLIIENLGAQAISARSTVETSYELANGNTKYVSDGKVDYSKFVYRKGKVNVTATPDDYFKKGTDVYKMVSIANELMFAYSTDTGCLNTYMGYSVSPYKTNFVKEFEYAAQQAVKDGVGAYYVVPTEFGWHIIITTFVFEDGEVYGGYNHLEAETEGTFSYIFYEYLKQDAVSSYRSDVESIIFNDYDNEDCVTRYESRYKDLLEM
ncbi:MAG: hypothetical protein IJ308_04730 [Clostridia bacterium]|nr:hypothetical protein [Clostridia bacterium]